MCIVLHYGECKTGHFHDKKGHCHDKRGHYLDEKENVHDKRCIFTIRRETCIIKRNRFYDKQGLFLR